MPFEGVALDGERQVADAVVERQSETGVGGGDLAGEARVGDDEVAVDPARLAAGVLVQLGEDERGHAWPPIPRVVGLRDDLLDQSATSRLSAGGRPTRIVLPPSRQWASAIRAISPASSTRADTGGPPAA